MTDFDNGQDLFDLDDDEELAPGALPHRKWVPSDWTRWGRRPEASDPLIVPFSWVTEEVSAALDRITTGEIAKRRRTLLKMADAVASTNREITAVLQDEDTVGHSAWYQRMKPDPIIQEVYQLCLQTARHWYDQLEGQRMMKRANVVEESHDKLIDLTGVAIQVMADMLSSPETADTVRRQLVVDVLDRAAEETATKSTHTVKAGQQTMRELANQRRRDKPDRSLATGGMPAVEAAGGARLIVGGATLAELGDDEAVEAEVVIEDDGTVGE